MSRDMLHMRRVSDALGFDPTNHHNAAVCPYCTHNGEFRLVKEQPEKSTLGEALSVFALIEKLRQDEGNSVTLICSKPDFGPGPEEIVTCYGDFTDWKERQFTGDTLLLALQDAVAARDDYHSAARAELRRQALMHHGEGPTGCADDALPGTAEDWRNGLPATHKGRAP